MAYDITSAIRKAAKKCGVEIKQSSTPGKKLDAFVAGVKIGGTPSPLDPPAEGFSSCGQVARAGYLSGNILWK